MPPPEPLAPPSETALPADGPEGRNGRSIRAGATGWMVTGAFVLLATRLPTWLFHQGLPSGTFLLLSFVVLVVALGLLAGPSRPPWSATLRRCLLGWGAVSLWAILRFASTAPLDQVLRFLAWTILALCALAAGVASGRRWIERGRIARAAGLAILVLTTTILIDIARPGTFSDQRNRAAGLAVNANDAAQTLVLLLPLAAVGGAGGPSTIALTATAGTGVFATLSRNGTLGFVLIVALGVFLRAPSDSWHSRTRALARAFVVLVGAGFLLWTVAGKIPTHSLASASARARLESPLGARLADHPRWTGARLAWQEAREAPWFGIGARASSRPPGSPGPHNELLLVVCRLGIVGLVLVAVAFLLTVRHLGTGPSRQSFLCAVLFVGLWAHRLHQDPIVLLGAGLFLGWVEEERSSLRSASRP